MTLLARTDLDQKVRSLGFNADGSHLAAGLGDGSFMVLKARYLSWICSFSDKSVIFIPRGSPGFQGFTKRKIHE